MPRGERNQQAQPCLPDVWIQTVEALRLLHQLERALQGVGLFGGLHQVQHRRNVLRQCRRPLGGNVIFAASLVLNGPVEPSLKVFRAGVGRAGTLEKRVRTQVVEFIAAIGRGHQRADCRRLTCVIVLEPGECRGELVRERAHFLVRDPLPQVRHVQIQRGDFGTLGGEPSLVHRVPAELFPDAAGQRDRKSARGFLVGARQQSPKVGVLQGRAAESCGHPVHLRPGQHGLH